MATDAIKIVAQNKKASHDYYILETYECGIVLTGTEIKAIRVGKVNLQDSFCTIRNNEMFVNGLNISKYEMGNIFNHEPDRTRKLLLHKKEIIKIHSKIQKEGYTLVPLNIILKNGLAKLNIGLAKGKKLYDKREDMKQKAEERELRKY